MWGYAGQCAATYRINERKIFLLRREDGGAYPRRKAGRQERNVSISFLLAGYLVMKPVLRSLTSRDLSDWTSLASHPKDCVVSVEAEIGAEDSSETDIVTFQVATPEFLDYTGQVPSAKFIVLNDIDWEAVRKEIGHRCAAAEAANWEECMRRIGGVWEMHWDRE
jgi:hypothetical protein